MIRACPEAASVATTKHGWLPLHYSIGYLDVRGVKALVEANPQAVVTKAGNSGQTPLHVLLEVPYDNSLEVAKVLVAARPDVLMVKDDEQGNIPLSTAIGGNDAHLPTVEWLINQWPESIEVANNDGRNPLHIAVREVFDPSEMVQMIYQAWPDSVKHADSDGMLPLALAVKSISRETFEFLLEAYPEAARAKDKKGRLPLHHAIAPYRIHGYDGHDEMLERLLARRQDREERFHSLLEAYPEALRNKGNEGMLPLHHAVRCGLLNTVTMSIAAWPDSVKEPTPEGEIPLFLAFKRDVFDEGIVKLLVKTWPDSIKCANQVGDLPIHMVSRFSRLNALFDTITSTPSDVCARAKHLIGTWPESLLHKNREGELPLHVLLSCMKGEYQLGRKRTRDDVKTELVRLFVTKCLESVEMVDGEGTIPLFTASQNDNVSLDVIDFLTRASMNLLLATRRRTPS